jgi:hypothetical protein
MRRKCRVLVLGALDELPDVAAVTLDLEHLDDLLVGAAVERAPQGADARRDRGEQVGLGASRPGARWTGGAVLLVVRVEDQQQVHGLRSISGSIS